MTLTDTLYQLMQFIILPKRFPRIV